MIGGALQCGSQSPPMVRLSTSRILPHPVDVAKTVLGRKSCSWIGSRPHNGGDANLLHRSSPTSFSGSDHWRTRNIH
jgi:hypothetical protein